MTLKITLTVDPDRGEHLIGLLAKALGRGEQGISDMRIEADRAEPLRGGVEYAAGHAEGVALRAVRSTVAKLVAGPPTKKAKRKGYELGMRTMKSGKANSISVTLRGLKHGGSREAIRDMWRAVGLNGNGLSPTLSKLSKRGFVKSNGAGEWRLTPMGEELEARLNAKVEHHDSQND